MGNFTNWDGFVVIGSKAFAVRSNALAWPEELT